MLDYGLGHILERAAVYSAVRRVVDHLPMGLVTLGVIVLVSLVLLGLLFRFFRWAVLGRRRSGVSRRKRAPARHEQSLSRRGFKPQSRYEP